MGKLIDLDRLDRFKTKLEGVFSAVTHTHKVDGVTGSAPNRYAACSTAAATAAKTASALSGVFSLETGARITVNFANQNTADNPTLNIDSTGAKNIFHKGSQITTGTNKAMLYGAVDFVYDGTQYLLVGNYENSITGVKGNAETDYRTGDVNITPVNIGAVDSSDFYATEMELSSTDNTTVAAAISSLCIQGDTVSVSGNTTSTKTLTGLTTNHVLCDWGLSIGDVGNSPADIEIVPGNGSYTLTITNYGGTAFTITPVFVLPQ